MHGIQKSPESVSGGYCNIVQKLLYTSHENCPQPAAQGNAKPAYSDAYLWYLAIWLAKGTCCTLQTSQLHHFYISWYTMFFVYSPGNPGWLLSRVTRTVHKEHRVPRNVEMM